MYCTETDILKVIKKSEYSKLTETDDVDLTAADIRDNAITDADSLINGYLKNAVTVLPLTDVPASIKACSVDITVFNLHARIQYADIPQFWKDRYDARIAFLKDIAKGIVGLDQTVSDEEKESNIDVNQQPTVFDRGTF
jgi:phage gp36-like protein